MSWLWQRIRCCAGTDRRCPRFADYFIVKAELEASAKKKASCLKLQESVKTYNMTMGEHNFALILIYYFRDSTLESRRLMLDRFLRPANWHEQNPDKKEGASPGPALECLNAFQQPEGEMFAFLRPLSLGDVRKIDLHQLATQPGRGYLQFLADWYNRPE